MSAPAQPSVDDVGHPSVRCEQDEEHPDEQHGQLLFELDQVAALSYGGVREDHAGDGGCGKAALMHDRIGQLVDQNRDRERQDLVICLGNQTPESKQTREHATGDQPRQDAEAKPQGDLRRGQDEALVRRPQHDLENDRCRNRTNRVDENAFGLENCRDRTADSQAPKERSHDRWPGHDHQCAKQRSQAPVPAERVVGRDRSADRGDHRTQRDEAPNDDLLSPKSTQLELKPTFEKNDRNAHTYERMQRGTQRLRIDDACNLGP